MGCALGARFELDAGVFALQLIRVELGEGPRGGGVLPRRKIKNGDGICLGFVGGSLGAELLTGPVEAAVPRRGQIASGLLAAEDLGENAQVKLAHLADVVRLVSESTSG